MTLFQVGFLVLSVLWAAFIVFFYIFSFFFESRKKGAESFYLVNQAKKFTGRKDPWVCTERKPSREERPLVPLSVLQFERRKSKERFFIRVGSSIYPEIQEGTRVYFRLRDKQNDGPAPTLFFHPPFGNILIPERVKEHPDN